MQLTDYFYSSREPFLSACRGKGRAIICALCLLLLALPIHIDAAAQSRGARRGDVRRTASRSTSARISDAVLIRILAAEDTRQWDESLALLLDAPAAAVRARAAVAAGRIGDAAAIASLIRVLRTDREEQVRAMAAFALGEIESVAAADALLEQSRASKINSVRVRVVEALGKIAAALPENESSRRQQIAAAVLRLLDAPPALRGVPDTEFLLSALTAVLHARPANASASVQRYVAAANPEVRATALNTLARLRATDANLAARPLLDDPEAVVRANAARVLGAGGDKESVEALIVLMAEDTDARVRVSAVRALASLKGERAAAGLRTRFSTLRDAYRATRAAAPAVVVRPVETNELLEVVTALGATLAGTNDQAAFSELRALRDAERLRAPEIEIALARISPAQYVRDDFVVQVADAPTSRSWQSAAGVAEGLGEIAKQLGGDGTSGNSGVVVRADALILLRQMLSVPGLPASARPAVLRATASSFHSDLPAMLATELKNSDIFVRATAAELLGEIAATEGTTREMHTSAAEALVAALPSALGDAEPDAALAILNALARLPSSSSGSRTAAFEAALAANDHLVRRRAAVLLSARDQSNAVADGVLPASARVGTVASRFGAEDYARAVARRHKRVLAEVVTEKGRFIIELLPEAAPLTIENFVSLAGKRFFDNVTFHRVVPNFVVQAGDPRGDGNGGPGYAIRCEINTVPYDRGAVGMALSGKDTGGSQWFVTHSPQPHLDGGYTVFGRVTEGIDVVDQITRGDRIRTVRITETARPVQRRRAAIRRRGAR